MRPPASASLSTSAAARSRHSNEGRRYDVTFVCSQVRHAVTPAPIAHLTRPCQAQPRPFALNNCRLTELASKRLYKLQQQCVRKLCVQICMISAATILLDRPFCERSILCFAHVSFSFFSQHTFRRLQTEIFATFPHDVALLEKEALLCRFPKSAP